MPRAVFTMETQNYATGGEYPREKITTHLVRCGYQPVSRVEDVGTFALRGSVVDFFSPDQKQPIRLDLFGRHTFRPPRQPMFVTPLLGCDIRGFCFAPRFATLHDYSWGK